MKIIFKISLMVLLLISLLFACKKPVVSVNGVELKPTKLNLTLLIDESATLSVTVFPADASNPTVAWENSNSDVATVNNGKVTAKAEGSCVISVVTEDGNYKATCTVTVVQPHPAESELVLVEGGTFTMGCTDDECSEDGRELPTHKVTVSSFKMAKYPVTNKQWESIMGTVPSGPFPGANMPVNNTGWGTIQEFIRKLNEATGKNYRLPTEAEWEFAARGGNKSKGYKYSGSNDIDKVAWYIDNSNNRPQLVGTKEPNELGIYDMSGNVGECCSDWYGTYSDQPQNNPTGPTEGAERVARGGNWYFSSKETRVFSRTSHSPEYQYIGLGLRLVLP
jgi:formylglycine-generating enzyme required for sulfatase activity